MKKYLSVLTAIVMTSAIALTSCGKNESEGSSSATSQAAVKENSSEENVSSLSDTEKESISRKYELYTEQIASDVLGGLAGEEVKSGNVALCPGDYKFSYKDKKVSTSNDEKENALKKLDIFKPENTENILRIMIQRYVDNNSDDYDFDKYNIRVLIFAYIDENENNGIGYSSCLLYTEEGSPIVRCSDKKINNYLKNQEINNIDDENLIKIFTDNAEHEVKLTWTEKDEKEKQAKIEEQKIRGKINSPIYCIEDYEELFNKLFHADDNLKSGEYKFRITDNSPEYDVFQIDENTDTTKSLEIFTGSCLNDGQCEGNYTFRYFVTSKKNIVFFVADDSIKGMIGAGTLKWSGSNYKKLELDEEEIEKITSINDKKLSEIVKNAEK